MGHNELLAEVHAIERGADLTSLVEWVSVGVLGALLGWLIHMGV